MLVLQVRHTGKVWHNLNTRIYDPNDEDSIFLARLELLKMQDYWQVHLSPNSVFRIRMKGTT